MRLHGAGATEWVARMWNAKHQRLPDEPQWVWPEADYWQPLLERIARDYLPYLHQNALAFRDQKKRFDYEGLNLSLKNTHTTNYRVYCRQLLQEEFKQLSDKDQQRLEHLFASHGGLSALHSDGVIDSGLSEQYQLPRDPSLESPRSGINALTGQPRN